MNRLPHVHDTPLAWPVLVVCTDPARVTEVRHALDAWPVPVALSVTSNVMAALRHALTQPSRLVVVDWGIDGNGGRALVRQLGLLRPTLPVLAFDDLGVGGPSERLLAWPWDELRTVLHHWLLLLVDERDTTIELTP